MTLLLAGHDTTANALTWSWCLLAEHPEVAEGLAANGMLHETAENVLLEAMRLYPPVYMFGRQAITKSTRRDGTASGTNVLLCQWLTHRDARFFPDPGKFMPQRWRDECEKCLPAYAYFPFGGGPRVCIGKQLALLEGTRVLGWLGRQFRVSLDDPREMQPWPTVSLRPRGALHVTVKPLGSATRVTCLS